MILEQKEGGNFTPHPPGIYPGVCVDVIELGLCRSEFQGQVKMVNKLKLVFETQCKLPDGQTATISKNFTATLHPKGKLTGFLGSWRGRAVSPAEKIDLDRLLGASCTLVISSQMGTSGRPYSSIDAVSKATVKLTPTGTYNGVLARARIAEWQAKQQAGGLRPEAGGGAVPGMAAAGAVGWTRPVAAPVPARPAAPAAPADGFGQVQPVAAAVGAVVPPPASAAMGAPMTMVAPSLPASAPAPAGGFGDDAGDDEVPF